MVTAPRRRAPNLVAHVVRSLTPETLAIEDAEALRWRMMLGDWIEMRAAGIRSPAPEYVAYEVSR
jgi:hypothetical protein